MLSVDQDAAIEKLQEDTLRMGKLLLVAQEQINGLGDVGLRAKQYVFKQYVFKRNDLIVVHLGAAGLETDASVKKKLSDGFTASIVGHVDIVVFHVQGVGVDVSVISR